MTRPNSSALGRVLDQDFFARPALTVARQLIGKHLLRTLPTGTAAWQITETEAYLGAHDLACHASRGLTPRTAVMFGPAGVWYVYFVYGMHWMLNVVTGRAGVGAAVLLRGAGTCQGPARLTKALGVDGRFNDCPAGPASGLWIEDRGWRPPPRSVARTPRIGVEYAGPWAQKPYRFVLTPACG